MVQWLRLHASNARHMGFIPGRGTTIPYAVQHGQEQIFFFFKILWKNSNEFFGPASITHCTLGWPEREYWCSELSFKKWLVEEFGSMTPTEKDVCCVQKAREFILHCTLEGAVNCRQISSAPCLEKHRPRPESYRRRTVSPSANNHFTPCSCWEEFEGFDLTETF